MSAHLLSAKTKSASGTNTELDSEMMEGRARALMQVCEPKARVGGAAIPLYMLTWRRLSEADSPQLSRHLGLREVAGQQAVVRV